MQRSICWFARGLAAAGIAFISLFALDAFQPDRPLAEAVRDFLVHLIPSVLLLAMLVVAWIRPLVGGILFLAVAALTFVLLHNPVLTNLVLSAPFLAAGLLFVACHVLAARAAK